MQCTSESNSSSSMKVNIPASTSRGPKYRYSVKVMDPGKKSNYDVTVLQNCDRFMSLDEIERILSTTLDSQIGEVGYISPGHGMKGRKHTFHDDDDVQVMYDSVYRGKCNILLWCHLKSVVTVVGSKQNTTGKKRRLDDGESTASQSKRTATQKKIEEVEEILSKLKEKHGDSFKIEHLNAWAHLIHVGKHSSYDTPPNYPYFVGHKSSQPSVRNPESDQLGKSDPSVLSPGKRVQLRSQCIEQLSRWHTLKVDGGISAEEYEQLRKNILSDIGKF